MANQLTDPNEGFKKTERIPQWTRHISWVAVAAPGPTTGGQSQAPAGESSGECDAPKILIPWVLLGWLMTK